jgi:uncharacterized protein (DUF433 family)
MDTYRHIIKISSDKRFGKPCVRDTRITVDDVLGWVSGGLTDVELIAECPDLTHRDILACLAFAAQREHSLQYA